MGVALAHVHMFWDFRIYDVSKNLGECSRLFYLGNPLRRA